MMYFRINIIDLENEVPQGRKLHSPSNNRGLSLDKQSVQSLCGAKEREIEREEARLKGQVSRRVHRNTFRKLLSHCSLLTTLLYPWAEDEEIVNPAFRPRADDGEGSRSKQSAMKQDTTHSRKLPRHFTTTYPDTPIITNPRSPAPTPHHNANTKQTPPRQTDIQAPTSTSTSTLYTPFQAKSLNEDDLGGAHDIEAVNPSLNTSKTVDSHKTTHTQRNLGEELQSQDDGSATSSSKSFRDAIRCDPMRRPAVDTGARRRQCIIRTHCSIKIKKEHMDRSMRSRGI
ncbi:hypothetical protein P280DRAFT_510196 [Massarina eburnea CBS 473.64]|uniref:Uncharacterized protein n=1 Tax=Massarina eburnea CBS 473.64 TaxID=1395130 RepID=A0A6A6RMZ5_9PLEO|nr:hypothetical protein P280DRAFT_510196 [Massarina eburnea CBS 473.64]